MRPDIEPMLMIEPALARSMYFDKPWVNNTGPKIVIDGNDAGWLIRQQRPKQPIAIADGNWHRLSILAKDNSITVSHDGKELYTANLTDPKLNKEGHIGFQGFVGTVKFRNIGIKEL